MNVTTVEDYVFELVLTLEALILTRYVLELEMERSSSSDEVMRTRILDTRNEIHEHNRLEHWMALLTAQEK